jgi:hypothetical protein
MVSKKNEIEMKFWSSAYAFLFFSLVLLINNLTDFTAKIGLQVPINWLLWTTIIGIILYTWYMVFGFKLKIDKIKKFLKKYWSEVMLIGGTLLGILIILIGNGVI